MSETISAHPLADLLPAMSAADYRSLRDDIRENGLQEPITLYEGLVLDGRHRLRACEETDTVPQFRTYEGSEPARYVVSLNIHRRHLTTNDKLVISLLAKPHLDEEARKRRDAGRERSHLSRGEEFGGDKFVTSKRKMLAREEAGALVGISGSMVYQGEKVQKEAPDLFEKIKSNEIKVYTAAQELRDRKAKKRVAGSDYNWNSERGRQFSGVSMRMLDDLISGSFASYADSMSDLWTMTQGKHATRIEAAIQVATAEEVVKWLGVIDRFRSQLRKLAGKLKEGAKHETSD